MIVEKSNFEHECHLVNQHELSKSQKYELQRFIDQNSHLLNSQGTGDSSIALKTDKGADRSSSYQQSYGTLSASPNRGRKEVKWSDDVSQSAETTRRPSPLSSNWSASSNNSKNLSTFDDFYSLCDKYNNSSNSDMNTMSSGNTGYVNRRRDNQLPAHNTSSNYQSYGKHPDDYNRYETARSRSHASQRQRDDDERSRFSGYGDRPGSGVEFMPTKWHGGEIITDPGHLPRSLKPRRLYYSPIGDGVVAADGVELKRIPKDLSPKVTVTHSRTLDRGEPGHDGYNIYTRTTTHDLRNDYGSDVGGSGRESRLTGGISPDSDSFGQQSGVGPGVSCGGRDSDNKGGAMGPGSGSGYGTGGGGTPFGQGKDYSNGAGYGDNGYPNYRAGYTDGSTVHESIKSERYHKFDVTKDYLITNPRELIHQYATTTPISILEIPETSHTTMQTYSSTTEEKYVPYPPYKGSSAAVHPNNFVRQIRNEGLTVSQREANRHQNPLITDDPEIMHKISEIRKETSRAATTNKEIDHLTEKMMYNLQSGQQTPLHY